MNNPSVNPFRLPWKNKFFASLVEKLLGLSKLIYFYDRRKPDLSTAEFLDYTLDCLDIQTAIIDKEHALNNLPKEGPLLITANHPLGGLEGVALAKALLEYRPDLQVLTNELLTRIPELASLFIGVDVLSGHAEKENFRGVRKATKHLKQGGALLLFPAGKVAEINIRKRKVVDHDWNRLVGHLVKKAKPTVLPVYVNGQNSRLFYLLALIHPILRALMLPRELSNKQGYCLQLIFGQIISSFEMRRLDDVQAITDYLRLTTELIKPKASNKKQYAGLKFKPLPKEHSNNVSDVRHLADFCLISTADYDVFCVPFDALGEFKYQLGLTREHTFREAGEGTGNTIDIDQFDPYYMHLFVWDKTKNAVAGGYRVGKADEIAAQHGLDALYSRTLYTFNTSYLKKLGKAIEMGRSFVHPDYQRQTQVLDLLWRGIGCYVGQNPEYYTLFGAVSISNEHSDLARSFIAESMLQSYRAEQRLLEDVKPVVPLKVSGKVWTDKMLSSLTDISLVNKLIGRCDPGKALPTLFRHYLSMNGKFVCFSVNKVFNDSLDGLIVVDLRTTPRKYLNRYLGKDLAELRIKEWALNMPIDTEQSVDKSA